MKKPVTTIVNFITWVLLACWLIFDKGYWEPIVAIFILLKDGVILTLERKVESLEYSPADALAYGYVNNFLEPAITYLLSKGKIARFYLYIPKRIAELESKNIDRMKAELNARNFQIKEIQLELHEGRARDVLTISNAPDKQIYFDFPNTLISLNSYLDFKLESKKNRYNEDDRNEYGNKLIKRFEQVVKKLLKEKDLTRYFAFTDKNFKLDF